MGMRSSGLIRAGLIAIILFLGWYTFQLYAELFGRLKVKDINKQTEIQSDSNHKDIKIDDPDALIDQKKLEAADKEWDKEQSLFQPNVKKPNKNPCFITTTCSAEEFSFKIMTGAANVIGPSVCFNGSIIMKNSLNNVDRGMNVAVFNGVTGKSVKQIVFDLYGKDSTELKGFLKSLKEDEIILITTSDDAAFKLDDEAKDAFVKLGSAHSKELGFRDNWIFVGGAKLNKPSGFEQIMKNDKEKNKYGDWPEAITLEGCIPRLK